MSTGILQNGGEYDLNYDGIMIFTINGQSVITVKTLHCTKEVSTLSETS